MNKQEAKQIVEQLLKGIDTTKKIKKQFKEISQQLDVYGYYFAPNTDNGVINGWNLMKDGLHYHCLTDELSFHQLRYVGSNIDAIIDFMPD